MIDFSSNFNALGPPRGIEQVVQSNPEWITRYSSLDNDAAQHAIANHLGVKEDAILFGAGTTDLIYLLPRVFSQDRAIVFDPTYWGYAEACRAAQKPVLKIPLDETVSLENAVDNLHNELQNKNSISYICNPNNPTSRLFSKDIILDLAANHPDSEFVIDETYLLFREDIDELSVTNETAEFTNLHVLQSLSKFFAVPGLRLGYLVSNQQAINEAKRKRVPYVTNPLADMLVPWMLDQDEYIDQTRLYHTTQRSLIRLYFDYNLPGMSIAQPEANFVLVNLGEDASPLIRYLHANDIKVREGLELHPSYGNRFRFCIKLPNENKQLLNMLNEYSLQIHN